MCILSSQHISIWTSHIASARGHMRPLASGYELDSTEPRLSHSNEVVPDFYKDYLVLDKGVMGNF